MLNASPPYHGTPDMGEAGLTISGRCQISHRMPMIKAIARSPWCLWRRGKANPRQPISSHTFENSIMTKIRGILPHTNWSIAGSSCLDVTLMPSRARAVTMIQKPNVTTYQPALTRSLPKPVNRSRMPFLSRHARMTMTAARVGPLPPHQVKQRAGEGEQPVLIQRVWDPSQPGDRESQYVECKQLDGVL